MSKPSTALIAANLSSLRERLDAAAARSPRAARAFKVIAVSKRHPTSRIALAHAAGHRDFGENYAAELSEKADELSALAEVRWHFIGHLQRNKVAKVIRTASLIHAVDSERLMREIDRRAEAVGAVVELLVAVNLAGESTKSGVAAAQCPTLVKLAAELENIRCSGLMTMPPLPDDPADNRPFFAQLRELRDTLATEEAQLPELSMGTTGDCEVAVEEGATLVRVGTAIFGPRE